MARGTQFTQQPQQSDTFEDPESKKSSKLVLEAIAKSVKDAQPYNDFCDRIDKIYASANDVTYGRTFADNQFDLLWSSIEIIKPAVYSQMPKPVVSGRFNDRNKTIGVASELLERCLASSFERGDVDETMLAVRDDLILYNRGVARVVYEDDEDQGKRVCDEWVSSRDFVHERARTWKEVGWVGFASYKTEREMKERFPDSDGYALATYYEDGKEWKRNGTDIDSATCKVWEVWHKRDKKVYWVTEGCEELLDVKDPFLKLEGFFPCPRPAYGTLRPKTLIPVPDYVRYEALLDQINELTSRIYGLLEWVRMKGLISGGGDAENAVKSLMSQNDDEVLLIPIPQAAFVSSGGISKAVEWLPLMELAQTIQGLIESRGQLIQDFYQLSGISDIMRGATEAQETLGAQQLKQQNGSIRVRQKVDELVRFARDIARISGEIIAEKFPVDYMLEMAGMELETKAAIQRKVKEAKTSAEKELEGLSSQFEQKADELKQRGPIEPEAQQQLEQEFQKAQQEIIKKYAPISAQLAQQVPLEDVKDLLRTQKARAFAIEIETDSTILKDELAEKQSRAEFMQAFAGTSTALQPLLMAGEAGAKLAGEILKFAIAPFRVGRTMDSAIDDFVEQGLGQLGAGGEEGSKADETLAQAQMELAKAEGVKAQAAVANAEAKAQQVQADAQAKMAKIQQDAQDNEKKLMLEIEKLRSTVEKTQAETQLVYAQIQSLGVKATQDQQKIDNDTVRVGQEVQGQAFSQERELTAPSPIDIERERAMLNGGGNGSQKPSS